MATTVPQPTLGPSGFTPVEESAILTAVQNDLDAAFGTPLDHGLSTPQGQIASSLTAIIADKNDLFTYYVSQVDPLYAEGRMQDAIGRIYFMQRIAAKSTVVTCTCTGLPGTVIPANTQAKDTTGQLYYAVSGTGLSGIPISGIVDLDFANQIPGPTECAIGAINKIYSAIPGWSSIYNSAIGILGRDVETSQEFELRRQGSIGINSSSQVSSVYAAIAALDPSPLDVYVNENRTSGTVGIGTVLLAPHSIYVAVLGGTQASIAQAIFDKVSAGCAFNGNTTSIITDMNYSYPQPTYTVKYQTPTAFPIDVEVVLKNSVNVPETIVVDVQNAVSGAFDGDDGGPRARIGSTTFASRFFSPVAALGPYVQIVGITLTKDLEVNVNSIDCEIDSYPTAGTITVSLV